MSAEHKSLTERLIETMAAVQAMDAVRAIGHPERHTVRELKVTAEQIMEQALSQANRLVEIATDLRELHRKIESGAGPT